MDNLASSSVESNLAALVKAQKHVTPITRELYSSRLYRSEISEIAARCPQTALAFGMHLYQVWAMSKRHPDLISRHRDDFVERGALMCSLNDPGTYFVRPEDLNLEKFPLKATRVPGGYKVAGKKPFSSMSSYVAYTPLTALEHDPEKGNRLVSLFVKKSGNSVKVANDWTSISMAETATNSIIFDDVFVADDDIIHSETVGNWPPRKQVLDLDLFFYRFHICTVYESIGNSVIEIVMRELGDESSPLASIRHLPHPQYQLATLLIHKAQNDALMASLCDDLDRYIAGENEYDDLNMKTLIVKESVTAQAETMVNTAMAIVGIRSLSRLHPLSSLYLNVKAGRFHPPQPASAYELIAKAALRIDPQREQRWGR